MRRANLFVALVVILVLSLPFIAGHRLMYGSSSYMEKMDQEVYEYLLNIKGYAPEDILAVKTEYNVKNNANTTYLTYVDLKQDFKEYEHVFGYNKEKGVWKQGRFLKAEN